MAVSAGLASASSRMSGPSAAMLAGASPAWTSDEASVVTAFGALLELEQAEAHATMMPTLKSSREERASGVETALAPPSIIWGRSVPPFLTGLAIVCVVLLGGKPRFLKVLSAFAPA